AELLAQPLAVPTLNRLGEIYHMLGRGPCARTCFEKAAGIEPANSDSANNQGVVYFAAEDYDRAEWFFQRAIELDPDNRSAHDNLERLASMRAGQQQRVPQETEVIVYQMTKVASTAVVNAIRRHNIDAEQSHFLGDAALTEELVRLGNPTLDRYFVLHVTGQLVRNLGLTRRLNWYRLNGEEQGKKVKIISMTRDPLSWFVAHFIQCFDGYIGGVRAWAADSGDVSPSAPLAELMEAFGRAVVSFMQEAGGDLIAPDYRDRIFALASGKGQFIAAVAEQALLFSRPLVWFDDYFLPVFGIDLIREPFDASRGYGLLSNAFADVLLLKFETLAQAEPVIGAFVGAPELTLERENVSARKQAANEIKLGLQAAFSDWLRDQIYNTPYCRQFGYSAP
ncbi:MAG: putative capsular polysaccharide synthesis family protein, partial [Gammaproteobacteria bacterium]